MTSKTIEIQSGNIVIELKRDGKPTGELSFDPKDIIFAEKYYAMFSAIQQEQEKYKREYLVLSKDQTKDKDGMPKNMPKLLKLTRDVAQFMRQQIDNLFGDGVSQAAFGDSMNIEIYPQFLEQITPFVEQVRSEKVEKYTK